MGEDGGRNARKKTKIPIASFLAMFEVPPLPISGHGEDELLEDKAD
jgi:hypothetical protein